MIVWRVAGWVMVLAGRSVLAHDVIAWLGALITVPSRRARRRRG